MIGWGCGLNMARDGCVSGTMRTMEPIFLYIAMVQDCLKELFLTWVTTITAPSPPASVALISATRSTGVTAAGRAPPAPSCRPWPAWPSPWLWSRDECLVFCERCLCAFVFPTRTLLLIKDEKLKCHKSSSGCVVRCESWDSPLKYALFLYFLFSIFLRLETRSIQICTCTLNYPG